MARIPYVTPEELPEDKRSLLDTLDDEDEIGERDHRLEGGTLNVYRTLGNKVDLLAGFRAYGSTVWAESGLTPHEREFVILSTAHWIGSAYEWHQHVRVALDAGLSRAQIRAVSASELDRLEPEHAAIVEYVRAFVDGAVEEATHERITEHYDDEVVLGIGLLAGLYLGLGRVLQAFDVETEVSFVGWDLEDL